MISISDAVSRKLPKDPLVRLFVINGVAGLVISALVLAGLFWANIGNLRVLVSGSENPVLPVLMLFAGLVITLGSVVIGSAVMLLGPKKRDNGSTGLRAPILPMATMQPIRVTADVRKRRY
ncbi:MAG: hypothetical protein ABJJ37_06670 [Roseibium sp.]